MHGWVGNLMQAQGADWPRRASVMCTSEVRRSDGKVRLPSLPPKSIKLATDATCDCVLQQPLTYTLVFFIAASACVSQKKAKQQKAGYCGY